MTKVTAGILAGILLGALYGLYNTWGDWSGPAVSASLLGRAAQGIINGVLAAYANKGSTPLWRGALWGILLGLGLGVLAGLPSHSIPQALPPSAPGFRGIPKTSDWVAASPPRRRNASGRAPTGSPSLTRPPLPFPPPPACTFQERGISARRP